MSAEQRPVHSPLGASAAERWMNCAGSVTLIKQLDLEDTDEPEYPREWIIGEDGQPKCTAFEVIDDAEA